MASTYRKDVAGGTKKKSLNKTATPIEKKSLNKTATPIEKKSFNKTKKPLTTSKTSGRGNNLAPLSSSTKDRYSRKTKSLLDKRNKEL